MNAVFALRREYAGRASVLRDGVPIYGPTNWDHAERKLDQLQRKARCKDRPCITCGTVFHSEGPHNRMCQTCRSKSDGMI